jgi:hypothetical protein
MRRGGLPEKLQAGIERLSGMSMDDVRVHYNSPHPAKVDALAYTQGNQIYVGRGAEQHLAHEAWHVVQQRQRRVRAMMRVAGRPVNDSESLEREAEAMGGRAMSDGSLGKVARPQAAAEAMGTGAAPVQRARRRRNRQPKYKDPVQKPEIRYSGINSPRDEVRRKMKIPREQLDDPVVGVPREFLEPRTEGSLEESLKKLPRAYGNHPDVRRLLEGEEDSAHKEVVRATSSKPVAEKKPGVTQNRVREVLAAVQYAHQNNLPTSDIRSAEGYDFDIGSRKIDPFEIPPDGFPANNAPKSNAGRQYFTTDKGRSGAYPKHTSGTKGGGRNVVGVLDQTYTHPDEVARVDEERVRQRVPPGLREDVRLPLEREYIRDHIEDTARTDPGKVNRWQHRGSDPAKKWGPRDPNRQATNKARYDREKAAKEALKRQKKASG